jgi:hypothetical protein
VVKLALDRPYPLTGMGFREENGFCPWADYEYEHHGSKRVTALYSEWQLLYLPIAREANITHVASKVLLEGGDRLVKWAESLRWFVESNFKAGAVLEERWLPTVTTLLRLQARYWPYVSGRSPVLHNAEHERVEALDLELQAATPAEVLDALGLTEADVRAEYEWFARRGQSADPAGRLYELLRGSNRGTKPNASADPGAPPSTSTTLPKSFAGSIEISPASCSPTRTSSSAVTRSHAASGASLPNWSTRSAAHASIRAGCTSSRRARLRCAS